MAFSRTLRLRRIVRQITTQLKTKDGWQHELAAMLSQTGCVYAPIRNTGKGVCRLGAIKKRTKSVRLSPDDWLQAAGKYFPRLEVVASIIKDQQKPFEEYPAQFESGEARRIAQGAQILRVALDYDQLIHNDIPHSDAVKVLKEKPRQYNPEIVDALGDKEIITGACVFKLVDSESVEIGMIVDEDIHTKNGGLVMAKGQEMSMASVERLQQLAKGIGVVEPFRVLIPWLSAKQKAMILRRKPGRAMRNRIIESINKISIFRPRAIVPAGLHHYTYEGQGERSRIHLRVDPDGSGILFVNANRVFQLNPTATAMAFLTLEKTG